MDDIFDRNETPVLIFTTASVHVVVGSLILVEENIELSTGYSFG